MDRRARSGGALTDPSAAAEARAAAGRAGARVEAEAEAAGLFGPDSAAWRLNSEAFLLLGAGPRALLLQLAHPLVAEGVAAHSDFRADPWGRLAGTLRSYLGIIFGGRTAALAEIARLNRLHRPIAGPVTDADATRWTGAEAYRARDPELSLWVHATLVESTLAVNAAWNPRLSADVATRFYAETLVVGRAFGIPDTLLPPDLAAFRAWWNAMLAETGPIHVTPTARALAATILAPPLAPLAGEGRGAVMPALVAPLLAGIPGRALGWLLWPGLALLPPRLRTEYGVTWGPAQAAVAAWLPRAWRVEAALLPLDVRAMPQARRAFARVRSVT